MIDFVSNDEKSKSNAAVVPVLREAIDNWISDASRICRQSQQPVLSYRITHFEAISVIALNFRSESFCGEKMKQLLRVIRRM